MNIETRLDPNEVFDAFLVFMRAAGVKGGPRPEKLVSVDRVPEERTGRGPAVGNSAAASDDLSVWDEPTKSRPDVVREYQQKTSRKVEHVESIIVEDEMSMTQPMVSAASRQYVAPACGHGRADASALQILWYSTPSSSQWHST